MTNNDCEALGVSLHLLAFEPFHRQQQLFHLVPELIQLRSWLFSLHLSLVALRDAVWARGHWRAWSALCAACDRLLKRWWLRWGVCGRLWELKGKPEVSPKIFQGSLSTNKKKSMSCDFISPKKREVQVRLCSDCCMQSGLMLCTTH